MPVYIVHPSVNLLDLVSRHLVEREHVGSAILLFPHRRPIQFLSYYLMKRIGSPFISPSMWSLEDWAVFTYISTLEPKVLIGELDQAWLSYKAFVDISREDCEEPPEWGDFFPWARRLSELFSECDLELKTPENLYYPPESIPDPAKKILPKLGRVYMRFNELLEERDLVTKSLCLRRLSQRELYTGGPVYIVGFYALTKAESEIFKSLYSKGAHIYWHADPERELPPLYRRWAESWKLDEFIRIGAGEKSKKTKIFLFEAHDLHSELEELRERLSKITLDSRPDRCAIVPLSQESLVPLIHALPDVDVNVTMGFPLKLTCFFSLIETIFSLVLGKDGSKYRIKYLVELFSNPVLDAPSELIDGLSRFLGAFAGKSELLKVVSEKTGSSISDFVARVFSDVISPFEEVKTFEDMARALEKLANFLLENPYTNQFERGIVTFFRSRVIPMIQGTLFSKEPMDPATAFRVLRDMVSSMHVPFEGEPLKGLQVMGLLETRLLSFDQVFFLDANEGILPKVEEINPLVPVEAKIALGLPHRERSEMIQLYHFERLIDASKEVCVMWQHRPSTSESMHGDTKMLRSRFVEKLIWNLEKKERKIFRGENNRWFGRSKVEICPDVFRRPEPLKKDIVGENAVRASLKNVSPTLLNVYLECPLKFLYACVLGIKAPVKHSDMDYGELGTVVHRSMERFFYELVGGKVPGIAEKSRMSLKRMMEIFKEELSKSPSLNSLSPTRKLLLEKVAEYRFGEYFKNHGEKVEIMLLEAPMTTDFKVENHSFSLLGKFDRVDRRKEGGSVSYFIVDYKTGSFFTPKWEDIKVLSELHSLELTEESLEFIRKKLKDIQIPLYVYILNKSLANKTVPWKIDENPGWGCVNAVLVDLKNRGEEIPFKKGGLDKEYGNWIKNGFPELLSFIVLHILKSPRWYPSPDERTCRLCEYWRMCQHGI